MKNATTLYLNHDIQKITKTQTHFFRNNVVNLSILKDFVPKSNVIFGCIENRRYIKWCIDLRNLKQLTEITLMYYHVYYTNVLPHVFWQCYNPLYSQPL